MSTSAVNDNHSELSPPDLCNYARRNMHLPPHMRSSYTVESNLVVCDGHAALHAVLQLVDWRRVNKNESPLRDGCANLPLAKPCSTQRPPSTISSQQKEGTVRRSVSRLFNRIMHRSPHRESPLAAGIAFEVPFTSSPNEVSEYAVGSTVLWSKREFWNFLSVLFSFCSGF